MHKFSNTNHKTTKREILSKGNININQKFKKKIIHLNEIYFYPIKWQTKD